FTGDLRYVINQADQPVFTDSTIQFGTIAGGVITLTQGELQISQNTIINGPGSGVLTISGGNQVRVFNITSQNATVSISGLTITKGNASPAPVGVGNQGGNIFNGGKLLTLSNDVVSAGVASGQTNGPDARGGGIFNSTDATLVLDNTSVTGNKVTGR